MMVLVERDSLGGKDTMPRRNTRKVRPQAVKGGSKRKSFWHALADGIVTLDEQVSR